MLTQPTTFWSNQLLDFYNCQHPCWSFIANPMLDFPYQPPTGLSTFPPYNTTLGLGLDITH